MTDSLSPPKAELSRSLKARHVSMITIGGIIGAGLFVGSSVAINAAGPAAIISYAITGFLVLLIMRMLGEMAIELPHVRTFTEFCREGLGDWAGFSVGWLYWYFWVIVIPVEAIAGAKILEAYINLPRWEIGAGLMAIMTLVNLMSALAYGEFEFWFSSIKVSAIIVFIALLGAHALGITNPAGHTFGNLVNYGGFAPKGVFAVLATVVTVFFSMMGSEVVTIAAAESSDPATAVAKMASSIIFRICVFYIGSVFLIVSVMPWTQVIPSVSPFAAALNVLNIPHADFIMQMIVLVAVLSCLNSSFYVASRVLFVLAAKGDAPQWLVQTNERKVPTRSVLLGSIAGFAGVIANVVSENGVFAFLVNASGALIVLIYILTALSQIRIRQRRIARGDGLPALPMWLFPYLSYFAVLAMVGVLIAMAISPEHQEEFKASVISVLVVLAAYVVHRRFKKHA